jgi:hypothetical protein
MKLIKSTTLSSFGGMNFVFEHLNNNKIDVLLQENLPTVAKQSKYSWVDIFYSFMSIYFCGGDCIEDLQTNLKPHFKNNPMVKLVSPDTLLRRLSNLSTQTFFCKTKRGVVLHEYCINEALLNLNIEILNRLGVFNSKELILDYDNTIIFNEKSDSKMTYKRDYGYQPGVCTVNEKHILYIENRNGNSDAKSFQIDTLKRLFDSLENKGIKKVNHFRADAASYQHEVIDLLTQYSNFFYIGCRNSYVEKYFTQVDQWTKVTDQFGELEIGSVIIKPFMSNSKKSGKNPTSYRLVVKRRPRKDGQVNLITQDSYDYRAIITNNNEMTDIELVNFYGHRGNMERQFDILKNDFGWNNLPFSLLNKNLVFLYFTAICKNLYNNIISHFSSIKKGLKPEYRLKKFIFRFVILPSKWIIQGRQKKLRIYSMSG